MLAVIWAIKKYRHYLEDRRFVLRTDNKALTWLHQFQDSRSKLKHWAMLLQEYSFDIQHCAGAENQLADILPRQPQEERMDLPDEERLLPPLVPVSPSVTPPVIHQIEVSTLAQEVLEAQRRDQPSSNKWNSGSNCARQQIAKKTIGNSSKIIAWD